MHVIYVFQEKSGYAITYIIFFLHTKLNSWSCSTKIFKTKVLIISVSIRPIQMTSAKEKYKEAGK